MAKKRRIMVKAKLLEISAVDKPAQPDAKMVLRKRDEVEAVVKLKPRAGESREAFVSRFMGDEKMKNEYPDKKQRAAVAMSMFRSKKNLSNEPIPAGSEDLNQPAGNESNMTPEQIAALQKRAERAEKALALSPSERELFNKMDAKAQDSFLDSTPEARLAEVQKAKDSNPIVYTDGKGREFRKSDDPRLVEMAKDADEERKARLKSDELAKLQRITKRAGELSRLPGESADHVLLVEAVEKLDTPEQREKVNALLNTLNSEFGKAFTKVGTSATPTGSTTAEDKLEALTKAVMEKEPTLTRAQAYAKALNSPEGIAAYGEHLSGVHSN